MRAELAAYRMQAAIFAQQEQDATARHTAEVEQVQAALRAELAARHAERVEQIRAKMHSQYVQQNALMDAQRELTDTRRKEEFAALQADRNEHIQAIRNILHAQLVSLQEVAAKQSNEIAEAIRQLALRRTTPILLPRKLRGVRPLFSKKKRRIVDDYRLFTSSPLSTAIGTSRDIQISMRLKSIQSCTTWTVAQPKAGNRAQYSTPPNTLLPIPMSRRPD